MTEVSAEVGVYLQNQPHSTSICNIAVRPCGICRAHAKGKKLRTPCLFLRPAEPSAKIERTLAAELVQEGYAEFVKDESIRFIRAPEKLQMELEGRLQLWKRLQSIFAQKNYVRVMFGCTGGLTRTEHQPRLRFK